MKEIFFFFTLFLTLKMEYGPYDGNGCSFLVFENLLKFVHDKNCRELEPADYLLMYKSNDSGKIFQHRLVEAPYILLAYSQRYRN